MLNRSLTNLPLFTIMEIIYVDFTTQCQYPHSPYPHIPMLVITQPAATVIIRSYQIYKWGGGGFSENCQKVYKLISIIVLLSTTVITIIYRHVPIFTGMYLIYRHLLSSKFFGAFLLLLIAIKYYI